MMRFDRDRWERQFLLSFNQAASRTDLLYAICLATFGLSAMHRLGQVPGTSAMVLATSAVLAYAPLLLLLATLWPSQYLRYRQPVLAAMKVWATFVATLLQEQHAGVLGGGVGGGRSPAEELAHAGFGLAGQLALHALGFQTTGVWLIMSQGFAVAVSARTAPLACSASLGAAVRQLLEGSPRLRQQAWVAAALEGLDAGLLCRLYALALQIALGYCLTVLLGLAAEWRQRRVFAAKHQLDLPGGWSLAALAGHFLAMLCLLLRVALATALPPALAAGHCPLAQTSPAAL